MHYAIGDVHGCYDQMLEIIDKIKSQDSDARFIFVGDFVDRGPKVWETLDWCLEHIDTSGDPEAEFRSVLGNHEDMLIDWYGTWLKRIEWGSEFIPATNYDFDCRLDDREYSKPEDVAKYIQFFKQLPLYIDVETNDKKFKIVHSWFPPDEFVSPRHIRDWYLWDRFYHYGGNYCDDSFTVIHGHTPTICDYHGEEDVPGEIIYRHKNINIDGGCVFNQQFDPSERTNLCGYCLETGKEFYVEGPDPDEGFFVEKHSDCEFGENGGNYIPDGVDFILFDVYMPDGNWWLRRFDVENIAQQFGIRVVPVVGRGTLYDAIEFVKSKPNSTIGTAKMEGVVCRPSQELFDRSGKRIIVKVKVKDFE